MSKDRVTVIALSSLLVGLLVTVWLSFGIGTGAINDYERFVRYTARLAFFSFYPFLCLGQSRNSPILGSRKCFGQSGVSLA